jgi:hypothetical protein
LQVRRVLERRQLRKVRDGAVDAAGAGRQHAHGDAAAAAIVDGVRPPPEVKPAGGSIDEDIVHISMILRRIAARSWLQFFGGKPRSKEAKRPGGDAKPLASRSRPGEGLSRW